MNGRRFAILLALLSSSAEHEWPGWRSQNEKDHVYAQFEEACQVYRKAQ